MRLKSHKGQTIVEFAMILPLLLIMILGVIDFGILLYNKAVITNASREAVRYGIVLRNPKYTLVEVQTYATSYCLNHMITFGGSGSPTATATLPDGNQNFGSRLSVQVNFSYTWLVMPRMAGFSSTTALGGLTVMKYE